MCTYQASNYLASLWGYSCLHLTSLHGVPGLEACLHHLALHVFWKSELRSSSWYKLFRHWAISPVPLALKTVIDRLANSPHVTFCSLHSFVNSFNFLLSLVLFEFSQFYFCSSLSTKTTQLKISAIPELVIYIYANYNATHLITFFHFLSNMVFNKMKSQFLPILPCNYLIDFTFKYNY